MIYLIVTLAVIFVLVNIILFIQLRNLFSAKPELNYEVDISIIIAAKNEEKNIPSLIESLSSLNYPAEKYEVIIVDDESDDKTYSTVLNLISKKNNFRVIKSVAKTLPGKKGALTIGIEEAQFDYIIITDADCQHSKEWIASFADKFNSGYELIFGITPYFQERSFVNLLTCFENLRSSILTFSLAKMGLPYSAAARSFGFTKTLFKKVNGYSGTLETKSGDDDLFLREAVKLKVKVGLTANKDAFIFTSSEDSFKKYLDQKARHTSTSLHYLFHNKILLGLWHGINILFLLTPFFTFYYLPFLFLFLLKILSDYLMVILLQGKFNYKFLFLQIIYYQIIYEVLLIIHFFNAIFKKVKWK